MVSAFNVVAPLNVVLPVKVDVPDWVSVDPGPKVIIPLAERAVVDKLAKDPAPDEFICAKAVPPLGTIIESNLPVFAEILPVDAPVRSMIPFTVSSPNTV